MSSHLNAQCACRPAEPPYAAVLNAACPIHGAQARGVIVDAIDAGRLIQAEPPGRCEFCGDVKETRPYGPNGENVCFPCGMKDEEAVKRAFEKRMGWAA